MAVIGLLECFCEGDFGVGSFAAGRLPRLQALGLLRELAQGGEAFVDRWREVLGSGRDEGVVVAHADGTTRRVSRIPLSRHG